jgi:C4-dicarboxylate transporter DctQ subunit
MIFAKIEYVFLAGAMLSTTLLLFINVMLRYVFGSAIFWAEEVLRYLIVWITFIGAATCILKGGHISLDTILIFLQEKHQRFVQIGVYAVGVLFSALLLRYSLTFTLRIKAMGQLSATIGGFPMYIVYSCIPLGSFLMMCRFGQRVIKIARSDAGHSDSQTQLTHE